MLDNRTLMLVLLLTSLVLSVVMTLVSRNQRQYPGPRYWAWAFWMVFLGVFLILLRGQIDNFLSVVVSNGMLFASFGLITHGLYRFLGLPTHPRFLALVCALGAALVAVFLYAWESTAARVVSFALTAATLILDGGQAVLRHAPAGGAWAYRFAGAAMGVVGGYQIIRAIITPMIGHPHSYFGPNPINAINSLVFSFTYLALAVGLVMMLAARLSSDLQAHMSDLRDEITIRRQAEERLAREATMDPLTGLANRRKLYDESTRALALARRHGRPLAVVMLDLDHFKAVNDRHGHEVGDAVLKAVAEHCRGKLRQGDTFARYGGEEFVILLPEADAEQAVSLAERLRSGLAGLRLPLAEGWVGCTCSFGVTELTPQDESVEPALRRADQALYLAKSQGRDRVVRWRQEDFPPPALTQPRP